MNILVVSAAYYPEISENLIKAANAQIRHLGKKNISTANVPGIFEIPVVISNYIKSFDGFIALGCVIKGKTPHFEFISKAVTNALIELSITYKKPIGNGIITCLNKKQALERSQLKGKWALKNKGRESARAVLSVLRHLKSIN